jgi:hypothetical protein
VPELTLGRFETPALLAGDLRATRSFGSGRARIGRCNLWRIATRLRRSAPCLVWIAE